MRIRDIEEQKRFYLISNMISQSIASWAANYSLITGKNKIAVKTAKSKQIWRISPNA